MKAVITVIGNDKVGIIAGVSSVISEYNINILDISQTTMQNIFTMIMLLDISNSKVEFSELSDKLDATGKELGVTVRIQHEDIFNSMHRV